MARKKPQKPIDVSEAGRRGGKARAAQMTPEERSERARKAVQAKWAKMTPAELAKFMSKVRKGRKKPAK